MRRRRSLVIVCDDTSQIILVRGWKAGELCRAAGMRPIYSGLGKGFVLDRNKLPDLVAFAEYQNVDVRIEPRAAA